MVPQKTRRWVFGLAVALALGGCGDRASRSDEAAVASPAALPSGSDVPAADRAMRISIDLTIASADVDETAALVKAATTEIGGYVAEGAVSGAELDRNASLSLKVPVQALPEFRRRLDGAGRLLSETERAEDVTDQRADLGARLKNARAEERRLLEIMAEKTGSLSDVLTAERSLAEVREKVERLEAQHGTLEKQIAYATVKVMIRSETELATTPMSKVGRSLERGWTVAGELALGIVTFVCAVTPSLLMLALLGFVTYRLVKFARSFGRSSAAPAR